VRGILFRLDWDLRVPNVFIAMRVGLERHGAIGDVATML
jgi:hypothetical protein